MNEDKKDEHLVAKRLSRTIPSAIQDLLDRVG
jgi:hypothetical protein